MVKGARRKNNPNAAIFEPLNRVQISYYFKDGRGIQNLREANILSQAMHIRDNMNCLSTSLSILDILDHTSLEQEPNPVIFRLVSRCLEELEKNQDLYGEIFEFFMLQLAIRSGFRPNLDRCGRCRSVIQSCVLEIETGVICCHSCITEGDIQLNHEQVLFLNKLNMTHIEKLSNMSNSNKLSGGINRFLLSFLRIHLPGMGNVKSLEIMEQLLNV